MTARTRTVFLGTGAFGLPILETLAAASEVELAAVVTAPARPAGRGKALRSSPIAGVAGRMRVLVLAPHRLRSPEAVATLRALAPGLLVLADYGQIVPPEVLALAAHGALNLHPSLLPRHRGASPIAAAILAGDRETGVTLMRMDVGLDSGPIVAQRRVTLDGREIAPDLKARLADVAAALLRESLAGWLAGRLPARPQPAAGVTMTRLLRRSDGWLDATRPARHLERQVRAYQPWPGSYLEAGGERLVVWRAEALAGDAGAAPGTLVAEAAGLVLATGEGSLRLLDVQPAGGRRMDGAALLRGRPSLAGSRIAGPAVA